MKKYLALLILFACPVMAQERISLTPPPLAHTRLRPTPFGKPEQRYRLPSRRDFGLMQALLQSVKGFPHGGNVSNNDQVGGSNAPECVGEPTTITNQYTLTSFEAGVFDSGTNAYTFQGTGETEAVVTSQAHTGTHSAISTVTTSGVGAAVRRYFPVNSPGPNCTTTPCDPTLDTTNANGLYMRWWVYIDSTSANNILNVAPCSGSTASQLKFHSSRTCDCGGLCPGSWITAGWEHAWSCATSYRSNFAVWDICNGLNIIGQTASGFTFDTWHRIQIHLLRNTTTHKGHVRVWVDGDKIADDNQSWYGGNATTDGSPGGSIDPSLFFWMGNYVVENANGTVNMWIDDVSAGNACKAALP
jgi:hypothetical protein